MISSIFSWIRRRSTRYLSNRYFQVPYFFALKSIHVHLLMSNGLALMIALVITIIAAMDHPFLGDVNMLLDPFQIALEHMYPGGR